MASPSIKYLPEEHERAYYQGLFKTADVQGRGQIGGADAVQFFTRSKLPIDTLKNIWTVADQPPSNYLDLPKFAVAVRLIQCMQNGQRGQGANLATPPGVSMRPAMFEGVSGVSIPLPPENPSVPGSPDAMRQSMSAQPQQGTPGRPPADPRMSMANRRQSSSTVLTTQDPYGMSPQDLQRMEAIFRDYAKEDGYVYGQEAVALFSKSGMPQPALAAIWNMVDTPVDNRLDKLEFAMAMHLIVCVSKKNLPMPGGLPPSLQQLKQQQHPPQASSRSQTPVPQSPVVNSAQQSTDAAAAAVLSQAAAPPPLGAASGGMNISDAFEGLSPEPEPEPEPVSIPEPTEANPQMQASTTAAAAAAFATSMPMQTPVAETPAPAAQVSYSAPEQSTAAAVAAPVATAAATMAVASNNNNNNNGDSAELNQMKELLTKLQAENISLKAQLSGTTEEEREVQQELASTIAEVARLSSMLASLRQEVNAKRSRVVDLSAALKSAKENAALLNGLIQEETATSEALDQASQVLMAGDNGSRAPAPVQPDLYGAAVIAPAATNYGQAPVPVQMAAAGRDSVELTADNAGLSSVAPEGPSLEMPVGQSAVSPQSNLDLTGDPTPSYDFSVGDQPGQLPVSQELRLPSGNPTHNRNMSTASAFGFNEGDFMGGAPLPQASAPKSTFNASTAPAADPTSFEEMRQKAKEADEIAREAEENSRILLSQVSELRKAAEEAEQAVSVQRRSSETNKGQKKKGMFGGGKQKKEAKMAEQMMLDAKAKKDQLLQVQGQANDAQALAMETRREADRLRQASEEAEVAQASANSLQQQPNGGGPQQPYYPPKQQQQQQQQTPPFQQGSMQQADASGGMNIPTPTGNHEVYANPFG